MSFIPIVPPKAPFAVVDSTSDPQTFVIPDLVSYCALDLRVHEELPRAVWESKAWMINGSNISRNEEALNSFHGLKAGGPSTKVLLLFRRFYSVMCLELVCACYPLAPFHKLRMCCDYLNWLWHIDDISDDMDDRGTVTIKDEIMTTYYHPDTHDPETDVGKLTKWFAPFTYQPTNNVI